MIQVRLPRTYDPELLKRDLEALRGLPGRPQPGPYHDGDWTGVDLYAQGGGQAGDLARLEPFAPTQALADAPYMASVLEDLRCAKLMVRLLTLPPGSEIEEHNDAGSNFQFGSLRLHIPVVTHPDVVMSIDSERVTWREGELWWGDFSRPHWLRNDSDVTRVHMVIDVEVDDFVLDLFPEAFVAERRAEGVGISTRRPRVELDPAELASFACSFRIPGRLMPLFGGGRSLQELAHDADATCRPDGDRLVVDVDGSPTLALDHVGDDTFAVVGQPPGISIELRRRDGRVDTATVVIRGVPEDLYAAQLGFQRGPVIPEQRVVMDSAAPSL